MVKMLTSYVYLVNKMNITEDVRKFLLSQPFPFLCDKYKNYLKKEKGVKDATAKDYAEGCLPHLLETLGSRANDVLNHQELFVVLPILLFANYRVGIRTLEYIKIVLEEAIATTNRSKTYIKWRTALKYYIDFIRAYETESLVCKLMDSNLSAPDNLINQIQRYYQHP